MLLITQHSPEMCSVYKGYKNDANTFAICDPIQQPCNEGGLYENLYLDQERERCCVLYVNKNYTHLTNKLTFFLTGRKKKKLYFFLSKESMAIIFLWHSGKWNKISKLWRGRRIRLKENGCIKKHVIFIHPSGDPGLIFPVMELLTPVILWTQLAV